MKVTISYNGRLAKNILRDVDKVCFVPSENPRWLKIVNKDLSGSFIRTDNITEVDFEQDEEDEE